MRPTIPGSSGSRPGTTLACWQGGDDETCPVTISLATDGNSHPRYEPFARVQWGAKGFAQSADVDITGRPFTIAASWVQVGIGLDEAAERAEKHPTVVVMLSFDEGIVAATRTIWIPCLEPGQSKKVVVPAFARSVRADAAVSCEFLSADDRVLYTVMGLGGYPLSTPLSPDDAAIRIRGKGRETLREVKLVFGLAL